MQKPFLFSLEKKYDRSNVVQGLLSHWPYLPIGHKFLPTSPRFKHGLVNFIIREHISEPVTAQNDQITWKGLHLIYICLHGLM